MNNYKIGIPAWKTGDNSFGVTAPYMQFITFFGEAVILTPTSEIMKDLDMILLPGGPDVDARRYNKFPEFYTGKPCPHREYFDLEHLPKYIEMGTPIYGICRGMQSLGVHFGATMDQHISGHSTNKQYDRGELVHDVTFNGEFNNILNKNLGIHFRSYKTNSIHHQVLNTESIKNNTELLIVGNAERRDGGHVELIAHPKLPIVGEQAHPEETYNEFALSTIQYLLENKKSILHG